MSIEIKVPTLGESVAEATVANWFKKAGDAVKQDEPLLELETDKVSVEVPSPATGVLSEIKVDAGGTVAPGAVLGSVREGAGAAAAPAAATAAPAAAKPASPPSAPAAPASAAPMPPSPAARKILEEKGIPAAAVEGSGRRGQVLKGDALAAELTPAAKPSPAFPPPAPAMPTPAVRAP